MAQIRGQYKTPEGKYEWVPLEAVLDGSGYVLKVAGGTGGSGVSLGTPKHYNGVSNILPSTIVFSAITKSILIENINSSNDLFISFDGGVSVFTLPAGESLALDAAINNIRLNSLVDGIAYQIVTTE